MNLKTGESVPCERWNWDEYVYWACGNKSNPEVKYITLSLQSNWVTGGQGSYLLQFIEEKTGDLNGGCGPKAGL